MHREILGLRVGDSRKGDHVETKLTLLNVRSNLRIATHAQNCANAKLRRDSSTGFKGVSFNKNERLYVANIQVNCRPIFLGYWKTPELAYEAYVAAAKLHFGEFARIA